MSSGGRKTRSEKLLARLGAVQPSKARGAIGLPANDTMNESYFLNFWHTGHFRWSVIRGHMPWVAFGFCLGILFWHGAGPLWRLADAGMEASISGEHQIAIAAPAFGNGSQTLLLNSKDSKNNVPARNGDTAQIALSAQPAIKKSNLIKRADQSGCSALALDRNSGRTKLEACQIDTALLPSKAGRLMLPTHRIDRKIANKR